MSTNPRGRSFLSYRRLDGSDAGLLIRAQQRRGIPTWQDVENLAVGSTEEQIRRQLTDDDTANGFLWITPDVADSSFILKVEIPSLMSRLARNDSFFIAAALAGGLGYREASALIAAGSGIHDISTWNLATVAGNLDDQEAGRLANLVLESRLLAIAKAGTDPIQIELNVRQKPGLADGLHLSIDWSRDFRGRHADRTTWQLGLLPSLSDVVNHLEQYVPGRPLVFGGIPTISAAVALGVECLQPRRLSVSWKQYFPAGETQLWSLASPRAACGFTFATTWRSVDADDVAVLVSVSDSVDAAFAASPNLPDWRAIATFQKTGSLVNLLKSPAEAADLAWLIRDSLRQLRTQVGSIRRLHLFMAVPVGLAVLIGQLLNTFGEVQVYEHVPGSEGGPGHYEPELLLLPAG